jgi:hypothetical protein
MPPAPPQRASAAALAARAGTVADAVDATLQRYGDTTCSHATGTWPNPGGGGSIFWFTVAAGQTPDAATWRPFLDAGVP